MRPATVNTSMTATAVTTEIKPVALRTSEMWREAIAENIKQGSPTMKVSVERTLLPSGPRALVLPRM